MRHAWSARATIPLRCCVGILLVFVIVNLPYRYAEYVPTTQGEIGEIMREGAPAYIHKDDAIFGGWPFRYLSLESLPVVRGASSSGQEVPWADASWSSSALLANSLIALAIAAVAAVLTAWSSRIATCAATLAILSVILTGGYHTARDLAVSSQLASSGIVYRSAFVPAWLNRFVPSLGLRAFSRVRSVMLYRFDRETVSRVAQLPNLHSLCFWHSFPPVDQLRPLMRQSRLHQLVILDAELDVSVQRFIASQDRMQHLALIRCRGLSGGLIEFDALVNLHTFDATGSDFPLSVLADSSWTKRLRHLTVSHPSSGVDTLELRDHHRLESLNIRSGNRVNTDPLTISLERVPQLRMLNIAPHQKVDLSIIDAPRLRELRVSEREEYMRGQYWNNTPVNLWLERVRLIDTPSLKRLSCYGLDLKSIELRDTPNLVELTLDSLWNGEYPFHQASQSPYLADLISDLAACDGPAVINLSMLPLQGLDLTLLTKNQRIRELKLAGTGITGDQVKSLMTLPRLTALDVRDCPISNDEAAGLLQLRPQLTQLRVDGATFERIEVIDHDQLVAFTSGPTPRASVVRIAGSPQLESELMLGGCVKEISIRDASALRGLSIDGPVPPQATLLGLSELRYLALGGANVDDRLCAAVWQCPQLNHLTLAYSGLSREALANIRHLEHLITLLIPGADIDDSITNDWWDLRYLSVIDLSHTRVSTQTFSLLLSRNNLQRLAINYVDLNKSDIQGLDDVVQLFELEVAGIGLEEQALRGIVSRGMIDRLDLSDSVISPETLRILASDSANSLVFLGIQNCGLSESAVRSLLAARPRLAVDVEGNPLSDAFLEELRQSNRLLSRRDRPGFVRRVAQIGPHGELRDSTASTIASLDASHARIDVHQFAPR